MLRESPVMHTTNPRFVEAAEPLIKQDQPHLMPLTLQCDVWIKSTSIHKQYSSFRVQQGGRMRSHPPITPGFIFDFWAFIWGRRVPSPLCNTDPSQNRSLWACDGATASRGWGGRPGSQVSLCWGGHHANKQEGGKKGGGAEAEKDPQHGQSYWKEERGVQNASRRKERRERETQIKVTLTRWHVSMNKNHSIQMGKGWHKGSYTEWPGSTWKKFNHYQGKCKLKPRWDATTHLGECTECWWNCGATGVLARFWWGCKMIQPL